MGELRSFEAKKIRAKGERQGTKPNMDKVRQFLFTSEYEQLSLLQDLPQFALPEAVLLYPGCGVDVLMVLLYLDHLFPKLKHIHQLFVDIHDTLPEIKTVLDEIGIPFSAHNHQIEFYWGKLKVELEFRTGDIFELLPSLGKFDIYFERAFRIMKDGHPDYEQRVVDKLNPSGILISDSGFKNVKLKRIEVPKELSAYGEMVMGRKE